VILFLAEGLQNGQYTVIYKVQGDPLTMRDCEQVILEALKERDNAPAQI
jgi:hypothetical protein